MEATNNTPVQPAVEAHPDPEIENLKLQIEQTRLERVQIEQEIAATAKEEERVRAEHREFLNAQSLKDAAHFGPKFYDPALTIELAKSKFDIRFDDAGDGTGLVDGRRVPLAKVFEYIATTWPTLVADKRTMPRAAAESTPVKARSEMSQAEKIEYLKTHSIQEFEKLPMRAVRTVEVTDFETYMSLPMSARRELIAKHGPDFPGSLPRAKRQMGFSRRPKI